MSLKRALDIAQPQLANIANRIKDEEWTYHKLVAHFFPDSTEKELDKILINKTGYPWFFAPKEGQTSLDVLIEQLWTEKYLSDRNQTSCIRCSAAIDKARDLCDKCDAILAKTYGSKT